MKVITILGARPQFIKAGSVSREFSRYNNIQEIIVHTGQHFDKNMSDIFFDQMQIPRPDYNLNVNGLSHGAMTGQMLEKIEKIFLIEKPDWVLVYGDTNSTLAGALAASKLHIKLAHVEAGLRSFNMNMPEEINRILTDKVSTILFCPTETAFSNLKDEGYKSNNYRVVKSGDVMNDGAIFYRNLAQKPDFDIDEKFILSTIHRAENTDDLSRLEEIFCALDEIATKEQVIMPLHPRTRSVLKKNNIESKVTFIDPVGYLEMVWLISNCSLVMTDSGGLQKEAFFFKKLCLTLRDETEWVELIEHNFNSLVGANRESILNGYQQATNMNSDFEIDLYGNGNASKIIIEELLKS